MPQAQLPSAAKRITPVSGLGDYHNAGELSDITAWRLGDSEAIGRYDPKASLSISEVSELGELEQVRSRQQRSLPLKMHIRSAVRKNFRHFN